ncbi:hypothetical protein LJR230_004946 [Trinickia sp. LjRoot230]|uniref:hypothetical protein n=1 Tax=Trinickia sp. LjRoot230 TaxID=3342288 RepID=UPI003ECD1597
MVTNEKAGHASTNLYVIATNGAPWQDKTKYPNLAPYNVITVFGTPGMKVAADAPARSAKFLEASNPQNPTHAESWIGQALADSDLGCTWFHLYMDQDNLVQRNTLELAATTVTISNAKNANDYVGPISVQFAPYNKVPTNTVILGYACNSGAPADGQTRASVYVGVDLGIGENRIPQKYQYVTVTLTNSQGAWIDGFGDQETSQNIPLQPDGTATAYIVSSVAQSGLNISVSTPYPNDFANLTMDFTAPPTDSQ